MAKAKKLLDLAAELSDVDVKSILDELIALGYPESVAKRIASGELDMSPQARLARAEAFGQDVYHASKQDISEFKAGYDDDQIFTTPNIDFANNWLGKGKYRFRLGTEDEISSLNKAEREFRGSFFDYDLLEKIEKEQGRDAWIKAYDEMKENYLANKGLNPDDAYKTIYPLKAKAEKTFDPSKDYEKILPVIEKYYGSLSEETIDLIKKGHYMPFENAEVTKWLRDNGYDSIKLSENADGRMTTFAVLSPNQLRSVNAAFDPQYTGSNILGSRVIPTVATGLLGASVLGSALAPQKTQAGALSAGTKAMKKIAKEAMAGDVQAEEQLKEAIKAYHGSPYDFEQFMLENIGTGEGAQAYGWGLYFAEAEKVAKGYRDALTKPRYLLDNNPLGDLFKEDTRRTFKDFYDSVVDKKIEEYADSFADAAGKAGLNSADAREAALDYFKIAKVHMMEPNFDRDLEAKVTNALYKIKDDFGEVRLDRPLHKDLEEIVTDIDSIIGGLGYSDGVKSVFDYVLNRELNPRQRALYDEYFADKIKFDKPEGRMYEVNIKTSVDDMLDWDKPLSQQSEKVLKTLKDNEDLIRKKLYLRDSLDFDKFLQAQNGGSFYKLLSTELRGYKNATEFLNGLDMKGIRYDDGLSRGKEGGTSNYVVFDPRIIEIARKYGVALPVAASMLTAGLAPQEAQAGLLGRVSDLTQQAGKRVDSLESVYTPEAIKIAKRETGRKGRSVVVDMPIDEYLSLAREGEEAAKTEALKNVDKFDQIVSLNTVSENGVAKVTSHEGRHRARRMREMGYDTIPVKITDRDIRFDQQTKGNFDYEENFPTRLISETGAYETQFPVRQGQSGFIGYGDGSQLSSGVIPTAGLLAAGAMAPEDAEAGALSRLARAREQGFTQRAFMGVRDDMENITQLDPDVGMGARSNTGNWMAQNPIQAETYATQGTMPFRLNTQNYATVDFGGTNWNDRADFLELELPSGETVNVGGMDTNEIARTARELGVDGVQFEQITDLGPKSSKVDRQGLMDYYDSGDTQFAVFNPASARSEFAQFDPNKVGSRDILAARPEVVVPAGLITAAALAPDQAQAQELDPSLPLTIGSPKQEVNYETMPSYYDYGDGATIPVRPPEPVRETKPEYLPAGMPVNPYTFMMSQGATQGEASRTLADAYSEIARGAANAIGGFGGEMETLGKGLLFAITGGPMGGTPFSRFMGVLGNYDPQLPNTQDVSEIPALLPNISPMTEEERRMYRTAGEFLSPL